MKSAIMSVGAFSIAMVVTTIVSVKLAPVPEPPIDTTALADSLLADSLWRDSVPALSSHGAEETHGNPLVPSATALAVAADPVEETHTAETELSEDEKEEALQSLAQIFARMSPETAAEILRHMSDSEVEGVVRNLGSRQAASVLSSLPEQRAAVLARRLMDGSGERD